MKVRILAAVAALALGTAISGGVAQAATYYLTVDGCSGTGGCLGGNTEVGTVTVNAVAGGKLDFSVTLDNGVLFNAAGNSGQHNALVFDLAPGGASVTNLTYSNFTTVNSSNQTVSTTLFAGQPGGPFSDSPFGNAWTNAVDYTPPAGSHGNSSSNPSNFSFELSDTLGNLSLAMLTFGDIYNGKNIMFAADVYNPVTGNTGNVGAVVGPDPRGGGGAVPEPASWGLMIMGVFCVGAAMRRNRAVALTAA